MFGILIPLFWNPSLYFNRRPFLGVLGSFFSGSTTISNLTFGQVQYVAAESIGVNPYSILGLQAVGGTAGNAVCINNIISGVYIYLLLPRLMGIFVRANLLILILYTLFQQYCLYILDELNSNALFFPLL